MRETITTFTILLALLFASCQGKQGQTECREYSLEVDMSIDMFSDSSYFSDIRCMQHYNNHVYALDVERKQVIVFDENFQNTYTIGKGGSGPTELANPSGFYLYRDTTYVADYGQGIKCFQKDSFLHTIKLLSTCEKRFFCAEHSIYLPIVTEKTTILKADKNHPENMLHGGEATYFPEEKAKFIRNDRNLLTTGSYLYTVSDNIPVIEKYDVNTLELIAMFDFSTFDLVEKNIAYANSKHTAPNSYYVQFSDAYLHDNHIYLFCANLHPDYRVNKVLKLATEPKMKMEAVYTLPGKVYGSFCISSDYLFAVDVLSNTINRFKLSGNE